MARLNIAEIEWNARTKQCLGCRIPDPATLQKQLSAWERSRNTDQKSVQWHFPTQQSRDKLK